MQEVDLHQTIDIKLADKICPTAKGEHCENCGTFVPGFEYKGCCSGRECGCMGKPIEPCICSQECYEAMFLGPITWDLDLYNREENQCKMGDYECEECFTPLKGYEYFGSTPCIICGHENCDLPF